MFFSNQTVTARIRKITIVGMLAAMLPVTAMAAGTFDYLGFDPESYSAAGQEGLNEIYSGRMFYTAFPLMFRVACRRYRFAPGGTGGSPAQEAG